MQEEEEGVPGEPLEEEDSLLKKEEEHQLVPCEEAAGRHEDEVCFKSLCWCLSECDVSHSI